MNNRKNSFSIKEKDKLKKSQKEKLMAMALATSIIAGNFPANLTYAEANVIDKLNSVLEESAEVSYKLNPVLEKSVEPNYTKSTSTSNDVLNQDKFEFEVHGTKVNVEIDRSKCTTTISWPQGNSVINNFVPTLYDYYDFGAEKIVHILMIGKDKSGNASTAMLLFNDSMSNKIEVINGDTILGSKHINGYKEIKSLGIASNIDGTFMLSGYAKRETDSKEKDGFIVTFNNEGKKVAEKIFPHTFGTNDDASINQIMKFDSGYIMIEGPNIKPTYINDLTYVDTRPIKESLTLANGKSYKVVEGNKNLRAASADSKTFTVKSVNELVEYDIATYEDVQDIKLIPGNENQVIIAVSNKDNSTKVGIINTDNDGGFDGNGEVVSKVVDAGTINDNNGPILNIDIENIKVNSNGQLSVTTTTNSAPVEVNVSNDVKPGTPIQVVTPKEDIVKEFTLDKDAKIKAIRESNGDIILKETDEKGNWRQIVNLEKVEIKEIKADPNSKSCYNVEFTKSGDNHRYVQKYERMSTSSLVNEKQLNGDQVVAMKVMPSKSSNEIGVEVKDGNTTITIDGNKKVITDFKAIDSELSVSNTIIRGIDAQKNYFVAIVTENDEVISNDTISLSGHKEPKIVSYYEEDDGSFLIGGSAKSNNNSDKNAFLVEISADGAQVKEKIIEGSKLEGNDPTIRYIFRHTNGYIRVLYGENLQYVTYINDFTSNGTTVTDNRPVVSSLTLENGKTYEVVEENTTKSRNKGLSTFTIKVNTGIFEYDLRTYKDVKEVKLVPGNDDQLIIAVNNKNNATDIGIVNIKESMQIENTGLVVINKVVDCGTIKDASGAEILDIENITINADGKLSVTTSQNSAPIKVEINDVKPGTPIQVVTPQEVVVKEFTLYNNVKIRAIKEANNDIILQETDENGNWRPIANLKNVEIKEIKADPNSKSCYNVEFTKSGDNHKYVRKYERMSTSNLVHEKKLKDDKVVSMEAKPSSALANDISIEVKDGNSTITINGKQTEVKDFTPVDSELSVANTIIRGIDSQNNYFLVLVTGNDKVIANDTISLSGHKEPKIVSYYEEDDGSFIIGGSAKSNNNSEKNAFLAEISADGKLVAEKIIEGSKLEGNDPTIRYIFRYTNGYIKVLYGENSQYVTYVNNFTSNGTTVTDNRPVVSSLTLENGKTYEVVEENSTKLFKRNKGLSTFTIKVNTGIFEYDLRTYTDVKEVKLVPGNDDQLIIAVNNKNNATDIGIVNIKESMQIENTGLVVINKVVDCGTIKDASGAEILDIENITINTDGKLSVTTSQNSAPIKVEINDVKPGTPIQVVTPSKEEVVKEFTLYKDVKIRAIKESNGDIILQETDENGNWRQIDNLKNVEIKEIEADPNSKSCYNVEFTKSGDDHKYVRKYERMSTSNLVHEKKLKDNKVVLMDVTPSSSSNRIKIETNNGNSTITINGQKTEIKDFTPIDSELSVANTIIRGIDSQNNYFLVLVTGNDKVIANDTISISGHKEPKIVSYYEEDDGSFIIGGSAKSDNNSDKNAFLAEISADGKLVAEKIIEGSKLEGNDPTIRYIFRYTNGYIKVLYGENSQYVTYVNNFTSNGTTVTDNRPVVSSLTLSNGKTYEVVKENTIKLLNDNDDLSTFTIKVNTGIYEYDLRTYTDVKEVKLVPGNNDQLIIAVNNENNTTDIGIVNVKESMQIENTGLVVINKVVDCGTIKDASGAEILDIENITIDADGKLSVTTSKDSTPVKVEVNNVKPGTPIDVITQQPPVEENKPDVVPPTEDTTPQPPVEDNTPEVTPPTEDTKPEPPVEEEKPEVTPPTEDNTPEPPVEEEKPEVTPPTEDTKPEPPVEEEKPEVTPPTEDTKPEPPVEEEKPEVTPPTEDTKPEPPVEEEKPEVTPPTEDTTPQPPVEDNKPDVVPPTDDTTPQPPVEDNTPDVVPPTEDTTPQPPVEDNKPDVVPPTDDTTPQPPVEDNTPDVVPPTEDTTPQPPVEDNTPDVVPPTEDTTPQPPVEDNKPDVVPPTEDTTPQPPVEDNKPDVVPPTEDTTPQPPVEDNTPDVVPPTEDTTPQPPVEEEKPEVIPPVENNQIVNVDKGEEIVVDITKPTNVTITSSKLENKDVEYILINGIKVTKTSIEYDNVQAISAFEVKEYFTVNNGSITLSQQLFEDLNLDAKDGYTVGVGFADGNEISELVKLNVVNSSVNVENPVIPPVEENKNNSTPNKENNSTTNKENNSTTNKENVTNKLPNTGNPISSGVVSIFGMVSAFVGTVLFKKKK